MSRESQSLLRAIWERKGIGAAVIGAAFSSLVDRYGEPSDIIDPRQYGLGEGCRIWNYDELQVWCSTAGVIDRVFYSNIVSSRTCCNLNFLRDMEEYREGLKDCDRSAFLECFGRDNVKEESVSSALSVLLNGMELFAAFRAEDSGGVHMLGMLRINPE